MLRFLDDLVPVRFLHTDEFIGNPALPAGFLPHDAQPGYLSREVRARGTRFKLIGDETHAGLTWNYGPLAFTRVMSDIEPIVSPAGPRRMVFWQRLKRRDVPPGWAPSRLAIHQSRIGVAPVPDGDIAKNWEPHAQRHLKRWQKQNWIIEPITLHEYIEIAGRSTLKGSYRAAFCQMLVEKITGHGERVKIMGARPQNGPFEAAFACLDIPETRISLHHVSCCTDKGKDADAGIGLMAWWFTYAQEQKIDFLDFGLFWTPGEPESWKGFSRFKGQFGVHYLDFPPLLKRMGGSWRATIGL